MTSSTSPGIVFLVGAGPGDPGLLTVAGRECLEKADVVVYDRLVHPLLLSYAPHAQLIDVGKRPDHHPVPQEEINALLVEHGLAGKTVVRLKGGDPFVFGRGGEEAEALALAGVPFEVIPGVTSAIAAPAYAGIPVTHRDLACSVTIVTGHRKAEADASCDWERAAQADTVVFLMGIQALKDITSRLIGCRRDPNTPTAVIERGSWPLQRTVTGTLETIASLAAEARIAAPATLIVGEVVSLRGRLRWYDLPERRPLLGLRILNTRSAGDALVLSRRLLALGAEPIELPAFDIVAPADPAPLQAALRELIAARPERRAQFDWVCFTSAHAVTSVCNGLLELGGDSRAFGITAVAAVGRATEEELARYGLRADLVPQRAAARALLAALGNVSGRRILLPQSNVALLELRRGLEAAGAAVTEVVAYETRPVAPLEPALQRVLSGELDAATFFSPSAVGGFAAQIAPRSPGEILRGCTIVCVGETTRAAAQAAGIENAIAAEEASVEGVVQALVQAR